LIAANATFALKAALWFRRVRFDMSAPDPRHSRRTQAENPLNVLYKFASHLSVHGKSEKSTAHTLVRRKSGPTQTYRANVETQRKADATPIPKLTERAQTAGPHWQRRVAAAPDDAAATFIPRRLMQRRCADAPLGRRGQNAQLRGHWVSWH
jgi:hypothetical protein